MMTSLGQNALLYTTVFSVDFLCNRKRNVPIFKWECTAARKYLFCNNLGKILNLKYVITTKCHYFRQAFGHSQFERKWLLSWFFFLVLFQDFSRKWLLWFSWSFFVNLLIVQIEIWSFCFVTSPLSKMENWS